MHIYHGCEGLSLITVPIHEGEARVRGQLAYDNPDGCHGISILYHRKMKYIMSGGNLRGSISCPEEI